MQLVPILLLTRPEVAAKRFLAGLPGTLSARFHPLISPLLKIVSLGEKIDTGSVGGLILTSSYAVAELERLGLPKDLPIYAVGAATTRAANAAGWRAVMVGKTADELVQNLPALSPAMPLLHLHGRHVRGDISKRLTTLGFPSQGHVVYDQVAQPFNADSRAALSGDVPVVAPLFSPRTAALFSKQSAAVCPLHILAFSPAVAAQFRIEGTAELRVCHEPTETAMHASLCDAARALCRVEGLETGE